NDFFDNILPEIGKSLDTRINDNFQTFDPAFNEKNDLTDECGSSLQEIEKLALKLAELSSTKENKTLVETKPDIAMPASEESVNSVLEHDRNECFSSKKTTERVVTNLEERFTSSDCNVNDVTEEAKNVWVLGASIGGPEAVKRFLARIPAELPVSFVLAQHLGDGFVSLLANQLDSVSHFNVKEGTAGDILRHGEVVIVPVNEHMVLDSKGKIKFIEEDWTGYYQKKSGVIIFSGMGADGLLACQKFSDEYEGKVWAQSSDTCVISSMPDSARKANLVSYSGSPEALALKIAVQYMGKDSYIV
ncbi:MAG: chemotaxis protein CheB, partial [gamma proteobacterium symbiont of Lucinoma myriamae]|nr:chemotaxis protein CheB [gamma proteobacterium symbiont of Lucinoma myriamae]